MDNKVSREFAIKFNKLSSDKQRYILAIQQALAFAQTSATEAEKRGAKTGGPRTA
ncbi:hypothetical protein LJC60_06365 [Ruminococcaceae bacterium OttesenSCG-928-D13]|nr:hypothetical protein [Ruminococcaceae bacterium OttesenSCG-928-D13]